MEKCENTYLYKDELDKLLTLEPDINVCIINKLINTLILLTERFDKNKMHKPDITFFPNLHDGIYLDIDFVDKDKTLGIDLSEDTITYFIGGIKQIGIIEKGTREFTSSILYTILLYGFYL